MWTTTETSAHLKVIQWKQFKTLRAHDPIAGENSSNVNQSSCSKEIKWENAQISNVLGGIDAFSSSLNAFPVQVPLHLIYSLCSENVFYILRFRIRIIEAGEMMAQYLRVLFSKRFSVQFSAPTWWLATTCNFSSKKPEAFFWPPKVLGSHVEYKYTCMRTKTVIHIKINESNF